MVSVTTLVARQLEAIQGVSIFVTEALPHIKEFGKSMPGNLSERQALNRKSSDKSLTQKQTPLQLFPGQPVTLRLGPYLIDCDFES